MVSDQDFQALKSQVAMLSNLLKQKVLGNDPSTNLGLSSQSVNFGGPPQAGSLTLQLNGVETSINNSIDPDIGQTVSLESKDLTTPDGDKLAIAPNALFILAWDGAAYQVVASISDSGGFGGLTLTQVGSSNQVTLEADTPQLQVTDGIHTSGLFPNSLIVGNNVGFSGSITSGAHTATFVNGICTNIT